MLKQAAKTAITIVCLAIGSQACYEVPIYREVSRNLLILVQREETPLPNASVRLIKNNGSAKEEFIGPYLTDRNGLIALSDVPEGDYTAEYDKFHIKVEAHLHVVAQPNAGNESSVVLKWPSKEILSTKEFKGTIDFSFYSFRSERLFPIANASYGIRDTSDTTGASSWSTTNGLGEFNDPREIKEGFYVLELEALGLPNSEGSTRPSQFFIPVKVDSKSLNPRLSIKLSANECYGPTYRTGIPPKDAQTH